MQFQLIFSKFVVEAALKYKPHLNTSRSQTFLKRIEAAASNTVLTVYVVSSIKKSTFKVDNEVIEVRILKKIKRLLK